MSLKPPNANKKLYRDTLLKLDRYRTECNRFVNMLIVLTEEPDSERADEIRKFVREFKEMRDKVKQKQDEVHVTG